MGALEWPPGALAVFLKKREILMRITSMLRDNFPLGIITFRAAQRGLFEIAVILKQEEGLAERIWRNLEAEL